MNNSCISIIVAHPFKANHILGVILDGSENNNTSILLNAGWNLIPIKTNCKIQTNIIYNLIGDDLVILNEIAGIKFYWFEANISTLEKLVPGKAYFINVL